MDLRDYLVMLRRGWPTIVAAALLGLLLASAYLLVTPKTFQSQATLLLGPDRPADISAASTGTQLAGLVAPTYAGLIRSPAVLDDAGQRLRPQLSSDVLAGIVSAGQRSGTSLIDIQATGDDASEVAAIANAVAEAAAERIPDVVDAGSRAASLELTQVGVAQAASDPVSPVTRPVLGIGLIIGLALGIAVAIARQALDTKIRNAADIDRSGGGTLFAAVPRPPRAVQLIGPGQWSGGAERYRVLRTGLAIGRNEARRSILVAAVRDGRDAPSVAANLALSIAQTDRTVLLIDLDLRTSPLRKLFRFGEVPGVGDVLTRKATLDEVILRPPGGVELLPSGSSQPHPSDLLGSPQLAELIREASRRYEHVVLYTAPVSTSIDALVVAPEVTTVLLTAVRGRTTFTQLAAAIRALRNVGAQPAGTVLLDRRFHWLSGTRDASSLNREARQGRIRTTARSDRGGR